MLRFSSLLAILERGGEVDTRSNIANLADVACLRQEGSCCQSTRSHKVISHPPLFLTIPQSKSIRVLAAISTIRSIRSMRSMRSVSEPKFEDADDGAASDRAVGRLLVFDRQNAR